MFKEVFVPKYEYDKALGFVGENVQAAYHTGHIFARTIATPSARRSKDNEIYIDTEIRKLLRRCNKPTKSGQLGKEGNPNRSITMIEEGVDVFGSAGLLMLCDLERVDEIYSTNGDTGRGKKLNFKDRISRLSNEEKQNQLTQLRNKLKLGGNALRIEGRDGVWSHNEIHYTIVNVDAIYFTCRDPHLAEQMLHNNPYAVSRHSGLLQAVYIQNACFQMTGEWLDLYEYSGVHNYLRKADINLQQIQQSWLDMSVEFVKSELKKDFSDIYTMPLAEMKVMSMYGTKTGILASNIAPADDNYDSSRYGEYFIANINAEILKQKAHLIRAEEKTILEKIKQNPQSILDPDVFGKSLEWM